MATRLNKHYYYYYRQDYTVACLNYTLQTMMPLPGWPVMAPNAYDNNNNIIAVCLCVGDRYVQLIISTMQSSWSTALMRRYCLPFCETLAALFLNGQTRSDPVWSVVSPAAGEKNGQIGSDGVWLVKKNSTIVSVWYLFIKNKWQMQMLYSNDKHCRSKIKENKINFRV